jgi:hypothetical protein
MAISAWVEVAPIGAGHMAQSSETIVKMGTVRRSMRCTFLYRTAYTEVTLGLCVLYVDNAKNLRVVCGRTRGCPPFFSESVA